MSQFIQAAYSACVLNIKFFLSDHDCDGSVLMSDSCFRRLCKQACSLHLLWIWLACSCASDQMTVRGYRRGCLQLFPFRLIIDRSELHISVVQRSPPRPRHVCVCTHVWRSAGDFTVEECETEGERSLTDGGIVPLTQFMSGALCREETRDTRLGGGTLVF